MAKFFIERPVLGVVISVVILLAGLAAVKILPVAQYPEITPPTVQVSCSYPGASASVVHDTVAAPIEQQVNGVENMLYMSSQCTNDGGYNLTVTFKLGTNLDMAQVLVQNRVNLALPSLPDAVKAIGVSTKKKSPSILLVVNFFSENDPETGKPRFDQLYLSNYATIQIRDELAKLDGVGDVAYLGQQDYSMRVWLDPSALANNSLTATDVINVLKEQNVQVAAGQIGQQPVPPGQDFQYTLSTLGRLIEAEQFGEIILKTGTAGEVVRLRDVSHSVLGAKNQDTRCTLDGKPSVGLAIYQLPGSNALETAEKIRERMKELKAQFPPGMKYDIVYDTTPFIEESVNEVFNTLRDAVILVAIVVLLFLQDWKAMILPMIDVPVSLIGTFAVMYAIGFTLNNLTLFGLVLAIGIVVDDAIVVLEAVEIKLAEGLDAKAATIKAMGEITGAIIAITLVLCSVFLPSALLGGISGQFYRQFALTIAASMIISAVNAMTMTPSRAVMIFKDYKHGAEGHEDTREALPWWGYAALIGWVGATLLERYVLPRVGLAPDGAGRPAWQGWAVWIMLWVPGAIVGWLAYRPVNRVLARFFKLFNRGFDFVTGLYGRTVGGLLRVSFIVLFVYGGLLGLTWLGFTRIPTGFIPSQDKGYLVVDVQLPDSASLERTIAALKRIEERALKTEGVAHTIGIPGQSFVLNAIGSNLGSMFVVLKDFDERRDHSHYSEQIARRLQREFYADILEAQVAVFGAPAVDGLGSAGGFKLMMKASSEIGLDVVQGQSENLADKGRQSPGIAGLFSSFRANTPQLYIDIDRTKCKSMGVPLNDVFNTLQVYLGGYYVNDFNRFGRTWQVNLQADAPFRLQAEDVRQLKVRNSAGGMVPLATVATIKDIGGPLMIARYNMRTAAPLSGASLPGVSSGTVIKTVAGLANRELPKGMTFEWTELTFLQLQEGSAVIFAFAGAVILVFLVLAAQYESYSLPLAIILVVPMCLLSALAGVALIKSDINIFVQVGFIVLVGLASKNAILIVAFAKAAQESGMSRFDAAVAASRSRLRPIIMTSFAFILGVVPLMIAHGAGAEMRRTLGTAVFAGMLGVTFFGIFLTPVFYYVIEWFNERGTPPQGTAGADPALPESVRTDVTSARELYAMPSIDEMIEQFRVSPGKSVRLKDFDPAWEGDPKISKEKRKEFAKNLLSDDVSALADAQDLLYASDSWSVLLIFQAMDAAGKDGTIKHVMSGVNPQGVQVYSFKHPSAEELDHDFLWRSTRVLPERGRIGIFNRSYYEEVLIVKVHPELVAAQRIPNAKLDKSFWKQHYETINGLEQHLTRNGTLILKFFLQISKDVQRRRFLDRINDPKKHWKFSPSDLSERAFWDDYQQAYEDMLEATSTKHAPWYVIPADHKWVSRAAVAAIVVREIEALDLRYPEVTEEKRRQIGQAKKQLESE